VALDASSTDLLYGRARGLDGGATLVAADVTALPFPAASFDVVLSALLLNHVRMPERAVAEMIRVLRRGGMVAAYVWDFAGKMEPLRLFWDAAVALDPAAAQWDQATKFPLCSRDRLAALFSSCGLADVQIGVLDVAAEFRDFTDLWEPLTSGSGSVVDYARSLATERLLRLREELRLRVRPAADGKIHLIARALAVRGSLSGARH
jgi:SAM-dependent methyltransferase